MSTKNQKNKEVENTTDSQNQEANQNATQNNEEQKEVNAEKVVDAETVEATEVTEDAKETTEEAKVEEVVEEEISVEEKLTAELVKEKDKFLRLYAEFENYKRRTSKERLDLFKSANSELMTALLPVLDDFDRGMNEISKSEDKELVKGVELIKNKLTDVLRQKNLEIVEVNAGDDFNSDIHDAITQIPAPTDDLKGKIVDVVEKGYRLGDKVIRHPKVVIGMK